MGAGGRVRMTDAKKNIETPPSKGVLLWGSVTLGETAQSDKWSASMRRTQDLIPPPNPPRKQIIETRLLISVLRTRRTVEGRQELGERHNTLSAA